MKKEKKDIKYFSTDKLYNVKHKRRLNIRGLSLCIALVAVITLALSMLCITRSVNVNKTVDRVAYTEYGKADYTVYLKPNTYYDTKYLPSGMQYVASLINTINTKFNYEVRADQTMDFNYTYKVIGTLQITDNSDENRILYSKNYNLLDMKSDSIKTDNLVINEDVDIDYDQYNKYVNDYKSTYALSANSRLIVTMSVNVNGTYKDTDEKLEKNNKLQITIPLSSQTVDIAINSEDINNEDTLTTANLHKITAMPLFTSGIGLLVLAIIIFAISIKLYKEYIKENIYTITVKKILREYDRLIVTGSANIDEKQYTNKVYPEKFEEMVDAAQNLGAPILYYEVIPGEKCFFVVTKNDTLYKFRISKAYLAKEALDNNLKIKNATNAETGQSK